MIPQGAVLEITPMTDENFKDTFRFIPTLVTVGSRYSNAGQRQEAKATQGIEFTSIIGHEGTAKTVSEILGGLVEVNRQAITLKNGDALYVAQPTGNRIAYGKEVDYPELSFFQVTFHTCKRIGSYSVDQLQSTIKAQTFEE